MSKTAVVNHPCDGCGQLDDHPMVHIMGAYEKDGGRIRIVDPSFHFDCLPPEYENLLGDNPRHENARATIEAARGGTHGDELREFILGLPDDNNIPDDEVVDDTEEDETA